MKPFELKSTYIIPNKWVSTSFFYKVTGLGKSKVYAYIAAGLIEIRKDGRNTLLNLAKYNQDLENNVFADVNLQNVYKNKAS